MPETVLVTRPRPEVALLTMNRPDKLNAMTSQLIGDLYLALDEVDVDNDIRVVILTGAGRGFCAGADLDGYGPVPNALGLGPVPHTMRHQQHIAGLVPRMRALRKPVIAAVNGPAAGGGFALALASDVRIAAESARFNAAFVKIGLSGCDIGVSWLLPRLVGASRAQLLLLTGRFVSAAEALQMGLVAEVVPNEGLLDAALGIAEEIAANSPFGVWMTKEVLWSNLETGSLQAGMDLENRTQVLAGQTGDCREAIESFVEKRAPRFRYG